MVKKMLHFPSVQQILKEHGTQTNNHSLYFGLGGVHKLRLQNLALFDHLPPLHLHNLWYESLRKVIFFDHLPPSSYKRSL